METNQNQIASSETKLTTEEMLQEIYENTSKTKAYMKWQLYITIVMVVLPLLAAIFLVPFVLSNLANTYSSLLK